jgi:hypothetical protein
MKRLIADGVLGRPAQIEGNVSANIGFTLTPGTWRASRAETPGGPMTNMGIHHVDTYQYLLGPIARVTAFVRRVALTGVEIDDVRREVRVRIDDSDEIPHLHTWRDVHIHRDHAAGDQSGGKGGTFNQLFPFGHYYFGNYYGPQYANRGFISWCNVPAQRHHYDPFFTYCGVHYRRQGIDFIGRCQGWHEYYVQHADQRPQRTWHEQQQFASRGGAGAKLETQLVARNIVDVAKRDDGPVKLTRLDDRTRQQQVERTEKFRELKDSRKKVEHAAGEVVAKLPKTGPKTGETVRDSTETRDKLGSLPDQKDDNAKGKEKNIDKKSKVDSGSVLRTASEIPKLTLPKDTDAGKRTTDKGKVGVDKTRAKIATGGNNDIPPPMPDANSVRLLSNPAVPLVMPRSRMT